MCNLPSSGRRNLRPNTHLLCVDVGGSGKRSILDSMDHGY